MGIYNANNRNASRYAIPSLAIISMITFATPTLAQDVPDKNSPLVFQELLSCRGLENAESRLRCYDEKVAALDSAAKNDEIFLADKAEVEKTRRGLFGFKMPNIKLFQSDNDEKNEFNELNTTITSVQSAGMDGWIITLVEGGVWQQNDTRKMVMSPKSGQNVRIRKGTLGSYLVNVNGQAAIKFRRIE